MDSIDDFHDLPEVRTWANEDDTITVIMTILSDVAVIHQRNNNDRIGNHIYTTWEMSRADGEEYLRTGKFPEIFTQTGMGIRDKPVFIGQQIIGLT